MEGSAPAAQIAQAGRSLFREAKGHMVAADKLRRLSRQTANQPEVSRQLHKLSRNNRQRARTLYGELEDLVRQCKENGIVLDLDIEITYAQGGTSERHEKQEAGGD